MASLFNNAIFVKKLGDLPPGEHWVILEFAFIHVPGDERSRIAPGHGYPERSEPVVNYIAFASQEDFEKELIVRADRTWQQSIGIHVSTDRYTTVPSVKVVKS
jgi:hypothetical protein